MSEGICIYFYGAIVQSTDLRGVDAKRTNKQQSVFKHVTSENGPLFLILQSYSQIFIVLKHID